MAIVPLAALTSLTKAIAQSQIAIAIAVALGLAIYELRFCSRCCQVSFIAPDEESLDKT
jgi:hypothetical protein